MRGRVQLGSSCCEERERGRMRNGGKRRHGGKTRVGGGKEDEGWRVDEREREREREVVQDLSQLDIRWSSNHDTQGASYTTLQNGYYNIIYNIFGPLFIRWKRYSNAMLL